MNNEQMDNMLCRAVGLLLVVMIIGLIVICYL